MVKGLDVFRDHFRQFEGFFTHSAEWTAILASLKATIPGTFGPENLRHAIRTYFRLPQ